MSRYRRLIIFLLLFILAALIAFPLRGTVFNYLIAPVSFLWFYLVYYYHVIPQQIYWFLILLVAAYIALGGILENPFKRRKGKFIPIQFRGPVESLSKWINDSRRGVYSRWRVSRALGIMAASILEMRGGGKSGRIKTLKGKDWNPESGIQDYLEAGLNGSYADFPISARNTPFDMDVEKVVAYLESQLEMNRGNNK
jgi:hypothetical protein